MAQRQVEAFHVGGCFRDAQVAFGGAAARVGQPLAGAAVLGLAAAFGLQRQQGEGGEQPGTGHGPDAVSPNEGHFAVPAIVLVEVVRVRVDGHRWRVRG